MHRRIRTRLPVHQDARLVDSPHVRLIQRHDGSVIRHAMSQAILDRELNDCLRVEMSWKEVASGIGKILTGYGIWVGGTLFALMLILVPIIENGFKVPNRLALG